MRSVTYRELQERVVASTAHLYDEREARTIALLLASWLTNRTSSALLADPTRGYEVNGDMLDEYIVKLSQGTPIQYITGQAEFYSRIFSVGRGVLIPRPETEELIEWVLQSGCEGAQILDVGCGSGAICISLALESTTAQLSAIDISDKALQIACANAKELGAKVEFRLWDALNGLEHCFEQSFDIIISNPPYIPQSDRATMHCNVTDWEPDRALFVADDDPIIFYRAIATSALKMLLKGGRLFFEIYEHSGQAIVQMLERLGYRDIELREDINSKPRMICATRG